MRLRYATYLALGIGMLVVLAALAFALLVN